MTWILDGVERKRPVAPWQTGHAYPVEWRGDLSAEERPETGFKTAKRWVDFSLAELGLSLPEDALSEQLRLGIILPVDRPLRERRDEQLRAVIERWERGDGFDPSEYEAAAPGEDGLPEEAANGVAE